eukprot:3400411-Rhodomonas_salina.4
MSGTCVVYYDTAFPATRCPVLTGPAGLSAYALAMCCPVLQQQRVVLSPYAFATHCPVLTQRGTALPETWESINNRCVAPQGDGSREHLPTQCPVLNWRMGLCGV